MNSEPWMFLSNGVLNFAQPDFALTPQNLVTDNKIVRQELNINNKRIGEVKAGGWLKFNRYKIGSCLSADRLVNFKPVRQ